MIGVRNTGCPLCFQDPRYRDDVDRVAGYTSTSLLCMAIRNADAEVIAVVQVVNKTESSVFNTDDEKVSTARVTGTLLGKAKMQYLLARRASRYCILSLCGSTVKLYFEDFIYCSVKAKRLFA